MARERSGRELSRLPWVNLPRRTGWARRTIRGVFLGLISATAALLLPHINFLGGSPVAPLPAYGQLAPIVNQASGTFDGAAGPITSNQTTVNRVAPPPVGGVGAGLTLVKTGDRAAAEPGDVVVYRLRATNTGAIDLAPLTISDQLPLGVQLVPNSVRTAPIAANTITVQGRTLTLTFPNLAVGQAVDIVYAATITPDAVRGSGRNTAVATAPGLPPVSANFQLLIRPGIVSDCGTIIGRVFVDRNFDGLQQPGEPGVPNAVIFMSGGNRVMTDVDGLFSLANVINGVHVGTLDLTSLPGYTLAPNLFWLGDNSPSRLVRLEPGGLARMNFAVTPTFGEGRS